MRYLEEWLDEYVKGIALVSARAVEAMDMVTEDNRKERGDYDDFFKIKKKEHHGTLQERMVNLEQDLKDYQEMLEVFVQALIKRGWSTREELEQRWKQLHEERPWAGGVIVAKAWTDPEFKEALLTTGREALREMGVHQGKVGKLVVVENTDKVHNLIVCTLCSCYPYDILGDTPWWYKHESYRTNIVQNPARLRQRNVSVGATGEQRSPSVGQHVRRTLFCFAATAHWNRRHVGRRLSQARHRR